MEDQDIADTPIKKVMGKPYPIVNRKSPVAEVSKLITKENNAVLIDLGDGKHHISTKHDIISVI